MTDQPGKDLVVQSTAYSRASLEERQRYVHALAKAGDLLPPNYRGGMVRNPETNQMVQIGSAGKIMLMAETGDMLGIHPMAALVGVHIIDGKPSLSANLMNGLVRKAGHTLRVRITGDLKDESLQAHATLIRADDPDYPFEVTWTLADARAAELYPGKPSSNWRKYPRAMLKSRAISEVIREGAADVLMGGNVYTPEELGAPVDEHGEPIEMPEVRDEPTPKPERTAAPIVDPAPTQGEPETSEHPAESAPVDEATGEVQEPPAAPEPVEPDFDWKTAVEEVKTADDALTLYRRAKAAGMLNLEIRRGRQPKRVLGPWLVEIGKALREAEEEAADAAEAYEASIAESGGTAAVLDADVVDAEIVEDGDNG